MKKFFLFLLMIFVVSSLHADWETVKYDRNEYVTLKSFCQFYKLPYNDSSLGREDLFLKNGSIQLRFRKGSRSCLINGTRYWLSINVEKNDQDWLISRKDITKVLDPILRPYAISEWKAPKGVVIDAGHGGDDRGAISRKGIREKDCTLDTALRLEKVLKGMGIETVLTRRRDVFIELETRAHIAAKYDDYIFVSLHFNDASGSARGIETYCFPPLGAGSTEYEGRVFRRDFVNMPGNIHDIPNIFLASCIHRQIIQLNPGDDEADRGVKRARFVVLKENQLPAVLVEGGFLSNRQESARISSGEYRQDLAEKVAAGIQLYFNRGVAPQKSAKPTETKSASSTGVASPNNASTNKVAPIITEAISTNLTKAVVAPSSTNSVILNNKSTNPDKAKVAPPNTSAPSIKTNPSPAVPLDTTLSITNSVSTNQVQEVSPRTSLHLTVPAVSAGSTNVVEDLSAKSLDKKLESGVKAPSAPPSSPRPPVEEEAVPSHEEPRVEIYMQSPQPRVPQVNLRLDEAPVKASVSPKEDVSTKDQDKDKDKESKKEPLKDSVKEVNKEPVKEPQKEKEVKP